MNRWQYTGWETRRDTYDNIHVLPMDDMFKHRPSQCWCNPTVDPEFIKPKLLTHNSADQREAYEDRRRQPS